MKTSFFEKLFFKYTLLIKSNTLFLTKIQLWCYTANKKPPN